MKIQDYNAIREKVKDFVDFLTNELSVERTDLKFSYERDRNFKIYYKEGVKGINRFFEESKEIIEVNQYYLKVELKKKEFLEVIKKIIEDYEKEHKEEIELSLDEEDC